MAALRKNCQQMTILTLSLSGDSLQSCVKDSEWTFPRVYPSPENLSLAIGLGHSFGWKWDLKGLSSGQRVYHLK